MRRCSENRGIRDYLRSIILMLLRVNIKELLKILVYLNVILYKCILLLFYKHHFVDKRYAVDLNLYLYLFVALLHIFW